MVRVRIRARVWVAHALKYPTTIVSDHLVTLEVSEVNVF